MEKKLYRSATDKKICGVCGGIAQYFKVDPTLVRVIWTVLACFGGSGLVAYVICATIMPEEPTDYVDVD